MAIIHACHHGNILHSVRVLVLLSLLIVHVNCSLTDRCCMFRLVYRLWTLLAYYAARLRCPSVCLSLCPILRRSHGVRRVCCCGSHRQTISIDCCTACLQQARPPFDPYPQQHGSSRIVIVLLYTAIFAKNMRNSTLNYLIPDWSTAVTWPWTAAAATPDRRPNPNPNP